MLSTSDRTSARQVRTGQLRDVRRVLMLPGIASRLKHALAIAGVPPDAVETRIHTTPEAIHIRLVQTDGRELTLDQLATFAAALRATEVSSRSISAEVA